MKYSAIMLAALLLSTGGSACGGSRIVSEKWRHSPRPDSCVYQERSLTGSGAVGSQVNSPVARDPRDGGVFCSIDISRLRRGNHHWLVWATSRNGKKSAKISYFFGIPPFAPSAAQRKQFMRSRVCPSTGTRSLVCPGYVVSHFVPLCAYGADLPINMRYVADYAAAQVKDDAELSLCSPKLAPGAARINNTTRIPATERAAQAGYEAAMQAAEARIQAHGCLASRGTFDLFANSEGNGRVIVELYSGNSYLKLTVAPEGNGKPLGSAYRVKGTGALLSKKVGYSGQAVFKPTGRTMTLSSSISQQRVKVSDRFTSKVTKEFYYKTSAPDPYVFDSGRQTLLKKGKPAAEYRQWSRWIRSGEVAAATQLWKESTNTANPCSIEIHTEGSNDVYGFSQSGTMKITPASIQIQR